MVTVMITHDFGRCKDRALPLHEHNALLYDEDQSDHPDQHTYAGARTAPEHGATPMKVKRQRLSKCIEGKDSLGFQT